ncbi:MAG: GNAT family N-acetyltransferase [Clostridiales bacterium]|nr:GNAT family N-acetyltransferase [Clostridiales bacterium]
MIERCTGISRLYDLPCDPFCSKITALALTYGFDVGFASFYIIKNKSITGALSLLDGHVNIFFPEKADDEITDELKSFLSFISPSSISTDKLTAKRLNLKISDESYIVKYENPVFEENNEYSIDVNYKDVYTLLVNSGFELGGYNDFLSDFALRINKRTANISLLFNEKNELISTASQTFIGLKSAVIGCVATDYRYRGKGLASKLVESLAQNSEKPVYIFCREDSLAAFYGKIGFKITGRWCTQI